VGARARITLDAEFTKLLIDRRGARARRRIWAWCGELMRGVLAIEMCALAADSA